MTSLRFVSIKSDERPLKQTIHILRLKIFLINMFYFSSLLCCLFATVLMFPLPDLLETQVPTTFNKWTVMFKVSDGLGDEFFGTLRISPVFDEAPFNITNNFDFGPQSFQRDNEYSFMIDVPVGFHLMRVYMETLGAFCINGAPTPALRLQKFQMIDHEGLISYVKELNGLEIRDQCEKSYRTILTDFQKISLTNDCVLEGKTYKHGEQFESGCTARCSCQNGGVGCVDMCPPFAWIRRPNETCSEVLLRGQCCPTLNCVDQDGKKVTKVSGILRDKECQKKRFVPGRELRPQSQLPSVSLICDEHCTDDSFALTVNLGRRWVVAYGKNIRNASNDYVRLQSPSTKLYKVESLVQHPTEELVLIKTVEYLPSDLFTQEANIPIHENHCRRLIENECPVYTPNWAPHPFLKQELFPVDANISNTGKGCNGNSMSSMCLSLKTEKCTDTKFDPIYSFDGMFEYLVGFQSSHVQRGSCQSVNQMPAVNICSVLDWIRHTVAN